MRRDEENVTAIDSPGNAAFLYKYGVQSLSQSIVVREEGSACEAFLLGQVYFR